MGASTASLRSEMRRLLRPRSYSEYRSFRNLIPRSPPENSVIAPQNCLKTCRFRPHFSLETAEIPGCRTLRKDARKSLILLVAILIRGRPFWPECKSCDYRLQEAFARLSGTLDRARANPRRSQAAFCSPVGGGGTAILRFSRFCFWNCYSDPTSTTSSGICESAGGVGGSACLRVSCT